LERIPLLARPDKVERHQAFRLSRLTNTLAAASDCHDLKNSPFVALRATFECRVSGGLLSYVRSNRLSAIAAMASDAPLVRTSAEGR